MTALYHLLALVPGVSQLVRGRYVWAGALGSVTVAAAIVGAVTVTERSRVFDVGWVTLLMAAVTVVTVAVVVSLFETTFDEVASRWWWAASVPVLVSACIPLYALAEHRSMLTSVSARTAPGPIATPTLAPSPPTTTPAQPEQEPLPLDADMSPTTEPPLTEPQPGRWNVAFLGGDGARGRHSSRTDALLVLSVDRTSGDLVVISVPRNLRNAPLPPGPLVEAFGPTYPDLVNSLYTRVAADPERFPSQRTTDPAADAVAATLSELLGVTIHDWVQMEMAGFAAVIDALGGVEVTVTRSLPVPGAVADVAGELPARFEPGTHLFDGSTALAYARTRSADSDYRRMERQRCLVAAALDQHSGPSLVARFPALVDAVSDHVQVTFGPDEWQDGLVLLSAADLATARTLALVPPAINPSSFDPNHVRELVAAALEPPAPSAPNVNDDGTRDVPSERPGGEPVSPSTLVTEELVGTCGL